MNLKYYLRGLGIGIVVAAILMGVATRDNETMTDAEIKERAAQLGMVEQKVLADISNVDTEAPKATPEVTRQPQQESDEAPTQEPEATVAPTQEPEATEAPTQEPVTTDTPKEESVSLTIRSGESSWTVSKTLAEYGVVEDAAAFDSYLSKGGYDKSICIGEFEIPMGATYEEIAKIITKKR